MIKSQKSYLGAYGIFFVLTAFQIENKRHKIALGGYNSEPKTYAQSEIKTRLVISDQATQMQEQ